MIDTKAILKRLDAHPNFEYAVTVPKAEVRALCAEIDQLRALDCPHCDANIPLNAAGAVHEWQDEEAPCEACLD
jgi:hypothetical protein